jgi:diguanylate cyclase (GGDEF)-like protein
VGARLSVLVREGELLARAGGDEFVLVQVGAPQDAEAAVARARADIDAALAEPLDVEGRLVAVGASLGAATSVPGTTAARLLDEADARMYETKALRA